MQAGFARLFLLNSAPYSGSGKAPIITHLSKMLLEPKALAPQRHDLVKIRPVLTTHKVEVSYKIDHIANTLFNLLNVLDSSILEFCNSIDRDAIRGSPILEYLCKTSSLRIHCSNHNLSFLFYTAKILHFNVLCNFLVLIH